MLGIVRKAINPKTVTSVVNISLRSVTTVSVSDITESIVERSDYPMEKCHEILNDKFISFIGYGPQGRGQSLNMRDNDFNVIVGARPGPSWDKAVGDGWVPGENLFNVEEAVEIGDVVQYLLSDAGQMLAWHDVYPHLTKGKTLCFSHGFGIVFQNLTGIHPPDDIDVVMVAPKGAGMTVRNEFLKGNGINTSYAIHQDYTGKAKDTSLAMSFGFGCGHAFETTFPKETYSDLTGERAVLMGGIQAVFKTAFDVMREAGHLTGYSYARVVDDTLTYIYPTISRYGMDSVMRALPNETADIVYRWAPVFKRVLKPAIDNCYNSVFHEVEAKVAIKANTDSNYREGLESELEEISNQEIWKNGREFRSFNSPQDVESLTSEELFSYIKNADHVNAMMIAMTMGFYHAQYEVLRLNGHSPTECFNETEEEGMVSLYPLILEKGMDWLYANCSTTAQRGALDWYPRFEKVISPVVRSCFSELIADSGFMINMPPEERVRPNPKYDYWYDYVKNHEMTKIAEQLRPLRPGYGNPIPQKSNLWVSGRVPATSKSV